jgi:hypothetical protein
MFVSISVLTTLVAITVVGVHIVSGSPQTVTRVNEVQEKYPKDILDLCYDFHRQYWPNISILVDVLMQGSFGENPDYDYKDESPETMEILPRNFGTEHKQILSHLYLLVNEGILSHSTKI